MPILLEKPSPAPAPLVLPSDLLHRRYHWERWRGLLFTLSVGLTATLIALWVFHLYWQMPGNGKIVASIWAAGFLLTLLAAMVGWRFAPSSLLETAQQMDRRLTAKNRLEASATLHGSTSLLAQAQREETAAYLSRQERGVRPVRALPWLAGPSFSYRRPCGNARVMGNPNPDAASCGPSYDAAQTTAPGRTESLHRLAVAGAGKQGEPHRGSAHGRPRAVDVRSEKPQPGNQREWHAENERPLPATPFDKPGKNILKTSLYMDELGVEPYDVVTYYIRAQRITDQNLPDTVSDIQFIQVRPFRDDVAQARGGEAISKGQALLLLLKLAELRSIKENFILAHTDLPITDPVRMKENDRVGKNQGELSAKTREVVQAFTQEGVPADIIDLLSQAGPPMDDAAKKILANQNSQALPSQQKALSFIVQVEKFFRKLMADKSISHGKPGPDDPFKDKQQHNLKKRMALASGQLETLARNRPSSPTTSIIPTRNDDGNPAPAGTPDPTATPQPGQRGLQPAAGRRNQSRWLAERDSAATHPGGRSVRTGRRQRRLCRAANPRRPGHRSAAQRQQGASAACGRCVAGSSKRRHDLHAGARSAG